MTMNYTYSRNNRAQKGLSQSKLSEISEISQAKLSAHELGKSSLSQSEIAKVQHALSTVNQDSLAKIKKKRFQNHRHSEDTRVDRPKRSYVRTDRNDEYLKTLDELESAFKKANTTKKMKAVSFFAGCGGLCFGVKAAGFDLIAANELEESFKKIYELNFPNVEFLPNDIRKITPQDLKVLNLVDNEIDLMVGGPPCQGFSLTGKRDVNDHRNTLFENYLDLASLIRPKVILMENVRLLTSMKDSNGESVTQIILNAFSQLGYNSSFFIMNAKDYGVPQSRERVIFMGVRSDLNQPPEIPRPTHGNTRELFSDTSPCYTFGDAVSDLTYLESGERCKIDKHHVAVNHPEHVLAWLYNVPEGKSAHENESPLLRPPSGYNTTYKRQVWNEPSATVSTTYGMISGSRNVHPVATRSLTTREALRLQSFPDSFMLQGNNGVIRTTIGNAVPPLLSIKLAKYIADTYIL
jgi:DNA (cytosine-5)-methyltransferase 1